MSGQTAALSSVGIVTRTRNRSAFVIRALRCVLDQTHRDWHLVLVNDGGDPVELRDAIAAAGLSARVPPGRLTILDNSAARGRAGAFNQGLAALETDLVACLDDDDSWAPDFLQALVAFFNANAPLISDLGGVAAGVTALREDVVLDAEGRQGIVALGEDGLPNAFRRGDFLISPIAYATYRHDLYPVQWILRRDAVQALGGFPEAFEVMEDRAFLLRFLQRWRIAVLDRPLAFHHRRVRRSEDGGQTAEMNTLDNPSYDWRRFADLSLPPQTLSEDAAATDLPRLVRAVGAAVVRELNDETSALWHKVDGEAAGLRGRIEALEARLSTGAPLAMPDAEVGTATGTGAQPVWALWPAVGSTRLGFALTPGQRFCERLELSFQGQRPGLLMHADPDRKLLQLQVPLTGDWCALELVLDALATPGRGLTCRLVLDLPAGGLFETAFVESRRSRTGVWEHLLRETHVHSAEAHVPLTVTRRIEAKALAAGVRKLSLILPRSAANLRLRLHDLTVTCA